MLAIIGGTGLYELAGMRVVQRLPSDTPFGDASGEVILGEINGKQVLFLARHGAAHRLLPHEINYRANVFALKRAGATMILGLSAVGSLRMELEPGDLVMPEQYFDWTKSDRARTFFGNGIAVHVSTAKPVSAALVGSVVAAGDRAGIKVKHGVTYACVAGPRLGTQAESHFLRQIGCDIVGMTNVPEVFLAREAQIAYATLGMVTDYDCWLEDAALHVNALGIFELYGKTLSKSKQVLDALLAGELPEPEPEIRTNLTFASLTPDESLSPEQKAWMDVLRR